MNDLINPDHFKSIEIEVKLTHTLSHKAGKNDLESKKETQPVIVEFLENSLKLEVVAYFCHKGNALQIEMNLKNSKEPFSFHSKVHVIEVESHQTINYQKKKHIEFQESLKDTVVIQFEGGSETKWQEFLKIFSDRQAEISSFLKEVKG